jgi:hypothetical protein
MKKDKTSPLASQTYDFDWAGLRTAMGEIEESIGPHDFEAMAAGLRVIMTWVTKGKDEKTIGRRAVALQWVLDPENFTNRLSGKASKPSGAKVAASFGMRNREMLSSVAAEASRTFKIRNRSQDHGWNFKIKNEYQDN